MGKHGFRGTAQVPSAVALCRLYAKGKKNTLRCSWVG